MDDNTPAEQAPDNPTQPEHSTRTWRACCLVPTLAVALILLIGFAASLYSPSKRTPPRNNPPPANTSAQTRRERFIEFGKSYFSIAKDADDASQEAFQALQEKMRGTGSLDAVHNAFSRASDANGQASAEFGALSVPEDLASREKIRGSLRAMSRAYDTRRKVCDLLVEWNGDVDDRATANNYNAMAEEVNRQTQEGIRLLAEAARDNQLTREDVRKFLPADALSRLKMDSIPWQ